MAKGALHWFITSSQFTTERIQQSFSRPTGRKAKIPPIKIRIPKHEISNKPEHSNLKIEIQNDLGKNPKSEYRNTKQFQNLNSQNPKPFNENFSRVFKCFEISILSFPFLFRVSDFVLRICNLYLAPFASLREASLSRFINMFGQALPSSR